MKKILIFILFCLFLLPLVAKAESLNYSNQDNHYSFTIPSGWTEIPKSTIDEVFQQMADQTGGQFIDYAAGFQIDDTPDFQYPYILVQEHKIDTPSYSQITQTFESDKFNKSINKELDKYSELMTNASLQDPFVDKERSIIFMNLEMDVTNVGEVKGLIALFLGKKSIIQLNFYSTESEYSENLSTFNQVIDSFKYESRYEYNEEEAKENDPSSIFDGTVEKGVTGAVAVGLFALMFGLFSRLKKKEDIK